MFCKFKRLKSIAMAAVMVAATPAAAIDSMPGDYIPLPAGTQLLLSYYNHTTSETLSFGGSSDVPGSGAQVDVGLLRYVRYSELGGMPVAYQALLPFGKISNVTIGGASPDVQDGLGDLAFGATLWPVVADPSDAYGLTMGISLLAELPSGSYQLGSVNIGSGTATITPQIGIVKGLGAGNFLDLMLDASFELDHTASGQQVSTDPSVQFQAYFRRTIKPGTNLSIGYSGMFGGEQKVNGVATGFKTRSDQIRLVADTFLNPATQIQGMLAYDLSVDGGFKSEPTVQFRLLKAF